MRSRMNKKVSQMLRCAVIGTLLLLRSAPSANADLTICNETKNPTGLAIGYPNGMTWISEGWWTIEPSACVTALEGDLSSRYYYIYAVHYEVGGLWKGSRQFCVSEHSFTIHGRENCRIRGYNSAGFMEIDTGLAVDWRHDLMNFAPAGEDRQTNRN